MYKGNFNVLICRDREDLREENEKTVDNLMGKNLSHKAFFLQVHSIPFHSLLGKTKHQQCYPILTCVWQKENEYSRCHILLWRFPCPLAVDSW